VDADSYLLELLRYIHRNPLEAGLVKDLNKYPWSSHKGYLSNAGKWEEKNLKRLEAVWYCQVQLREQCHRKNEERYW
jgi:hypothetical protein